MFRLEHNILKKKKQPVSSVSGFTGKAVKRVKIYIYIMHYVYNTMMQRAHPSVFINRLEEVSEPTLKSVT